MRRRAVSHPCPVCGRPCWGRLCASCYAESKPPPRPRRADLDDWRARESRRRAVAAHRDAYGDICPGWGRPAHPAQDLTADHPLEVVLGGDPNPAEYLILCRGCNGRKANIRRAQARRGAVRVIDTSRDW